MIDDCLGKMLGVQQARGFNVPMDAVEEIGPVGAKHLAQREGEILGATHRDAPASVRNKEEQNILKKWFVGDALDNAKGLIASNRNPSGLFGEDMIRPVHEFIRDHHADFMDDLSAGRDDYFEGIQEVFDGIDVSHMSEAQQTAWDGYRAFYERGGELYGMEGRNVGEKMVSNLTGNLIKSSPTVILGNIAEGAIKLPALYPKTFMQAIGKAWDKGIIKELPELAAEGVYGINHAGEKKGVWQGLIGATDIPLKNIAYFAGELEQAGGGARAVQRVSFTPRFGDLPSIYYSGGGRMMVSLLSYTINSYKMYADLWKTGNWQGLITYHALAGLIGGGVAAGLPKPVEEAIKAAFPESEQWFEENKGATAGLIQPGNITRLAVPLDIAATQVQRGLKEIGEGKDKALSGDPVGGAWDMALGAMKFSSLSSAVIGDMNAQKVLQLATDAARHDDAAVDEDLQRLNPFK